MRQSQHIYYAAKAKRNRRRHVWWLVRKSLPFVVVTAIFVAQYLFPKTFETKLLGGSTQDRSSDVYYRNCAAAWAAGVAPISYGNPGYRDELDGDSDGIACEPYRHHR